MSVEVALRGVNALTDEAEGREISNEAARRPSSLILPLSPASSSDNAPIAAAFDWMSSGSLDVPDRGALLRDVIYGHGMFA